MFSAIMIFIALTLLMTYMTVLADWLLCDDLTVVADDNDDGNINVNNETTMKCALCLQMLLMYCY